MYRKTRDLITVPICSQFNITVILISFRYQIFILFSMAMCMCLLNVCPREMFWYQTWNSFFLFLVNVHPTLCWTLTTTVTRVSMQNNTSIVGWQLAFPPDKLHEDCRFLAVEIPRKKKNSFGGSMLQLMFITFSDYFQLTSNTLLFNFTTKYLSYFSK